MESERSCTLGDGTERSWNHIWALDALFGVLFNHADDVATTTTKETGSRWTSARET